MPSKHLQKSLNSIRTLGIVAACLGVVLPLAGAQVVNQVTDFKTVLAGPGALDDAGARVVTGSSADFFGANSEHAFQLVFFDAQSGAPSALYSHPGGVAAGASISDDGVWLAFVSPADLTGANHDESPELFVMRDDGTGLAQLSDETAVDGGSIKSVAISGDSGRVVFTANTDPLGQNPAGLVQLFVIQRDGSSLAQLTSFGAGTFGRVAISDDGSRIVFGHDGDPLGGDPDLGGEVYAINADGSSLAQLTTTPVGYGSGLPDLSGNGGTIAFQSDADLTGSNDEHWDEIFSMGWDGSGLRQITDTRTVLGLTGDPASQFPSIVDDGSWVYYHSNYSTLFSNFDGNFEIGRVRSDGTGRDTLTSSLLDAGSFLPVVSGSGNRVAFYGLGSELSLRAMDGGGDNEIELLEADLTFNQEPALSEGGERIAFIQATSLLGGGQVWRVESDGSGLAQVSSLDSGTPSSPSITADRQTIVFALDDEIWKIGADGSGLTQLTAGEETKDHPVVSADGSVILYELDDGTSREIYRMGLDGSAQTRLTTGAAGTVSRYPRVDSSGSWVVFESNADLDGSNPDGSLEIYRAATGGGVLEALTAAPGGDSRLPDISGSGEFITFSSTVDHLGANPEGNRELFLYDTTGAGLSQLTSFASGSSGSARISGSWVYFYSSAPIFEDDIDQPTDLFRISLGGTTTQRVSALRRGGGLSLGPVELGGSGGLSVAAGGQVAVFSGLGDFTESNADLMNELWVIDRALAPAIRVGKESPTLVSWSHESGPLRYDVLRGDLAEIGDGPGSSVDLGPVLCLEDDSPNADTDGYEDALQPGAGEGFFFLTRGTKGILDGPGSYGAGSDGSEREPGSGGCP